MNILLVIDQFDDANNGTTISAKRFAEVFLQHGNEVKVVTTGRKSENKYDVRECWLPPVVNRIVKQQGMTFAKPDRKVLERAISQADIVHFYMPFPLEKKGMEIARRLKKPYTAAFHVQPENITYTLGLGKQDRINNAIYHYFRNYFFQYVPHIHCPSQFIAGELKERGYTADLHVISNGIDRDFVYRKLPKEEPLKGKFVIVMTGRFSNEKRQDLLFDAVRRLDEKRDIQIVLAGKGPNEKRYRKMGVQLKNPPMMAFLDKENMRKLLAMSDLYVHTADAEIEAISCMEAFASGLVPIIANSPKSATPQFALDERSLFAAGDSADLARKIEYWIDHETERKKMEKVYSEHARQFNIDACVNRMEEMFRQAIEENATN